MAGDNRRHHRRDPLEPRVRFDLHEPTISHLLREPHPALSGRSFGGALRAALAQRGVSFARGVVELGGGLGVLAGGMLGDGPFPLCSIDLSPRLLAAQRRALGAAFRGVLADASALPLRSGSVAGLLLANEVVADLEVCEGDDPRLARFPPALGTRLVNLGALELVAEAARVLGPGGWAVLTEYRTEGEVRPVELRGGGATHVEHTVRFDHLAAAARVLGLVATVEPLAGLLGADLSMPVASTRDLRLARLVVPGLPLLAFPESELRSRLPLLLRWLPLEMPRLGDRGWPDPHSKAGFAQAFVALLLHKPA